MDSIRYNKKNKTIFTLIASLVLVGFLVAQSPADGVVPAESDSPGLLLGFFSYNAIESKIVYDQLLNDVNLRPFIEKHFKLINYYDGRDIFQVERYRVTKFPTLIVAKADGQEIDRIVGYRRSQEIIAMLEAGVRGESELEVLSQKVSSPSSSIEDRIKLAEGYIKRGEYEKALSELTICLDRCSAPVAKEDRKYLKAVLARFMMMKVAYPSCLDALRSRRDSLEKSLVPHFPEPIFVVMAFNDALEESALNVDIYKRLPEKSPLRERIFPMIFTQLVKLRLYHEAASELDLEGVVNSAYPKKKIFNEFAGVSKGAINSHATSSAHRLRIVNLTVDAVEASLGVGELEKAKRIAGRAIETFNDGVLLARLYEASKRASSSVSPAFNSWLEALSAVPTT